MVDNRRRLVLSSVPMMVAGLPLLLARAKAAVNRVKGETPKPNTNTARKSLPEGWQAVIDKQTDQVYYWQPSTDVTQWEFPEENPTLSKRKTYITPMGTEITEPDHLLNWIRVVGTSVGILMINHGMSYQSEWFPTLKRSRKLIDYYFEMEEKYGSKDDEPLEEVGYRAREIEQAKDAKEKKVRNYMMNQKIGALAAGADEAIDSVKGAVSGVTDYVKEQWDEADPDKKDGVKAADAKTTAVGDAAESSVQAQDSSVQAQQQQEQAPPKVDNDNAEDAAADGDDTKTL